MYGTVMTARLRGSAEDLAQALKDWENDRDVPGYVDAQLLVANDGRTVVEYVRFTSRAAYDALADDPDQAKWWDERIAPLLDGEATWIDGTWIDH